MYACPGPLLYGHDFPVAAGLVLDYVRECCDAVIGEDCIGPFASY